jgi:N4-gp56 family major capsid protein
MGMQTYGLQQGRIEKYKGRILKHAVPKEVLSKTGRQVDFPKNQSKTYIARRWLPSYGATSTDANTINRFFQNGTGDRGQVFVQQHQIAEGVTPAPDSLTPQDVTAVIQQYGCLYGFSDATYNLYEDDIPAEMVKQIGERVGLVNEMIMYGILRQCTNQFFGGTGTSVATVNGALTLGLVRKIVKGLQANHAEMVNSVLKASPLFGTDAVAEGFTVYCHTDLEPDIRDLPNFTPTEKYASGAPMPNEVGKVERFRFITSPDLPSIQDAGATVTSTSSQFTSTSASNIDVYPFIVAGQDAWSQIAVRGLGALDPTFIKPGEKSKSDPLGQRGYAGTTWWKTGMVENNGWMAVGFVGSKVLS